MKMGWLQLFQPPANKVIGYLLFLVAVCGFVIFIIRFLAAYRNDDKNNNGPLLFIGGMRGLVVALTCSAFSFGFLWQKKWLLIIGLVIICQEMCEGFVLSSILKAYRKKDGPT
jgi:hypothetical protein